MVNPSEYLVLDVETNGLKVAEDDLLSISIYKPDDDKLYNRLLPLEKQTELNPDAASIHGLRKSDLKNQKPLDQVELTELIVEFEMNKRTVLAYGGRRFDERFLKQYLDDHGLVGIENVRFLDFKTMVHSSGDRFYPASKDNLCRAFGIEGVTEVHTSANDCLLEWKLFEAMDGRDLLVNGPNVFKLNPDYIMPASYLDRYTGLRAYAGVPKRYVIPERVFELELSDAETLALRRFPNNFTGNAIEHLLNTMLHAQKIDSLADLVSNKMKLDFVGSFEGSAVPVYTEHREDGSVVVASEIFDQAIASIASLEGFEALVTALRQSKENGRLIATLKASEQADSQFWQAIREHPELYEGLMKLWRDSFLTEAITHANMTIKPALMPLVEYLSSLLGNEVLSQELRVNSDDGCLALCDLSSDKAVVEIKTGSVGLDLSKCSNQLYYSADGRDCYVLHVEWANIWKEDGADTPRSKFVVDKVSFSEKRPKRPRGKTGRKARIRHAVTDWRLANQGADPVQCAFSLWLKLDEVSSVWAKSDPSRMYSSIPNRGKKRETYDAIARWRQVNPNGSRTDLAAQVEVPMAEIERWWLLADPRNAVEAAEGLSVLEVDDASIRDTISDLVDEANTYALWPLEKVLNYQSEVYELCRRVGITTSDYSFWSLFYPNKDLSADDKKHLVSKLVKLRDHCLKEIEFGVVVLRVPLAKTRYKTRNYYMDVNSEHTHVEIEQVEHSRRKGSITVYVNGRKTATIQPRSHKLYSQAALCVGKSVLRAFIERSDEAPDGELVLATCSEHCEEIWKSYWEYRYSDY